MKIIEEESKKFNDPIKFQELINKIYLSKKIIRLARLFFGYVVQEEELGDIIKHNKFSEKNMKNNYKKLQESQSKCNINELTCLTSIELNKITRRNFVYFSFVY